MGPSPADVDDTLDEGIDDEDLLALIHRYEASPVAGPSGLAELQNPSSASALVIPSANKDTGAKFGTRTRALRRPLFALPSTSLSSGLPSSKIGASFNSVYKMGPPPPYSAFPSMNSSYQRSGSHGNMGMSSAPMRRHNSPVAGSFEPVENELLTADALELAQGGNKIPDKLRNWAQTRFDSCKPDYPKVRRSLSLGKKNDNADCWTEFFSKNSQAVEILVELAIIFEVTSFFQNDSCTGLDLNPVLAIHALCLCHRKKIKSSVSYGRLILMGMGIVKDDDIKLLFEGFGTDDHLCGRGPQCKKPSHKSWNTLQDNVSRIPHHDALRKGRDINCDEVQHEPACVKVDWSKTMPGLDRNFYLSLNFRNLDRNVDILEPWRKILRNAMEDVGHFVAPPGAEIPQDDVDVPASPPYHFRKSTTDEIIDMTETDSENDLPRPSKPMLTRSSKS